jgi:hypothetical protein
MTAPSLDRRSVYGTIARSLASGGILGEVVSFEVVMDHQAGRGLG